MKGNSNGEKNDDETEKPRSPPTGLLGEYETDITTVSKAFTLLLLFLSHKKPVNTLLTNEISLHLPLSHCLYSIYLHSEFKLNTLPQSPAPTALTNPFNSLIKFTPST